MFQFNSIRSKLIVIFLISLIGMLAITVSGLISEKNTLLEDRKIKTRHLVEAASGILQHFHELQSQGKMTESDAKAASLTTLKALRYEKTEYFWVNDMRPYILMHPTKPQLDGTDVSDLKDPEGKALFLAFVDMVKKNGAGFVPYMWPKPGSDQPIAKISYVMGFEPWGWVLGSGIYIDDVDRIFRERAVTLISITLVITALIGLLLFFLIRGISRPIHDIQDTMRSIQQTNDLSRRVKVEGGNEISEIAQSFNELLISFQGLIRSVVANSHEVKLLSSKLSHSATQLAEDSLNQSDASNDMAAAVEETQASIAEVSSNAQNANQIAEQAGALSRQGEKTVADAATEMRCIATSVEESARHIQALGEMSGKISSIVNVIKEIADQTNLLALNAAIEAARAGEQGRGFAVVADEVRKLAERTTQSTVEIAQMINSVHTGTVDAVRSMEEGSARVNGGVELATEAGASMALIREGASQVIGAVGDINNALSEQNEAVQLIVSRVGSIVTMAENNRLETGEIASTATRLEQIAKELEVMVDQFKT